MKLETALRAIELMADKGEGFSVTLHVSPERTVTIKKELTIKHEEDVKSIVEKLINN